MMAVFGTFSRTVGYMSAPVSRSLCPWLFLRNQELAAGIDY
jgi:hypothetical protein